MAMKMEIQTNSTEKQRVFAIFDPRKPPTRKLTKRSIFEHRFNSQIDWNLKVSKIGFGGPAGPRVEGR